MMLDDTLNGFNGMTIERLITAQLEFQIIQKISRLPKLVKRALRVIVSVG